MLPRTRAKAISQVRASVLDAGRRVLMNASDRPRALFEEAGRLGLFETIVHSGPEDADVVAETVAGFAEGCTDGGLLLSFGAHCFAVCMSLARYGNTPLHETTLQSLVEGSKVGAFAVTEAQAGSDVMALSTCYTENGGGFRLNGTKHFISNAPEADVFLVLATRDPRLHFRGLSAFLVARDSPGLSVATEQARVGSDRCTMGTVYLRDVAAPSEALLGGKNRGWKVFSHALRCERALMAGFFVGMMRHQCQLCIDHARTRVQFGRPIASYQHVSGRIVEMHRAKVTSWLLFSQACSRLYEGNLTDGEAALAKLHASESLMETSLASIRTLGGSAFQGTDCVARQLADAASSLIYSGTSDLQRVLIASELGLDA